MSIEEGEIYIYSPQVRKGENWNLIIRLMLRLRAKKLENYN